MGSRLKRSLLIRRPIPVVASCRVCAPYLGSHSLKNRFESGTTRPLPLSITDRIPPELIDLVVDNLRYDRGALYTCMLVCRAWHLSSRRLSWCCVVIRDHETFKALRRYAIGRSSVGSHLSSTHFLAVVRHNYPYPLTLSRYMPNLRCLHLTDCRVAFSRPLVNFVSQFTALEHLFLSNFTLHSFGDLHRLIFALPHIRELSLVEGRLATCASTPLGSAVTFIPNDAPGFHSLHLDNIEESLLVPLGDWIVSTGMHRGMTRLALSSWASSPMIASRITLMMQALGPSLTHLEYLRAEDSRPYEPLTFCTRLTSARVTLGVELDSSDSSRRSVEAFHDLISSLRSTVIRTIELYVVARTELPRIWTTRDESKERRGTRYLYSEVRHKLMRPQFNSLQHVTVYLRPEKELRGLDIDEIHSILAPWYARGILTVHYDKL